MTPNDSTPLRRQSLNGRAGALVRRLVDDAASLRIQVDRTRDGAVIIDAGIDCAGGIEAGLRIAEICMAGLGKTQLTSGGPFARWPWMLHVHTSDPVLACLGSQLAGWQLAVGEGKSAFHALGSGPGRALAAK
jgi:methenyltetrahydromethanopterin cyclohydrolase